MRAPAGAVLGAGGTYRYRLWRRWGAGATVLFVLLNPSTADAHRDDPTLRRCLGFARRWGCGGLEVVNLFALRSTDRRGLRAVADPVGPENDRHIGAAAHRAGLVVAGWGEPAPDQRARAATVAARLLARVPLHCLGTTQAGQPRHPLYLPADTPLRPWP